MSSSGWRSFSNNDAETVTRQRAAQVRYFVAGLALLAASALLWPLLGRGLENLQFMPHVFCYLGNSTLISVNLVSDLLIGISYVVISLTLLYMVRASRGGIPFHWMFLAFGTFIIACGGTHFMEAITLWHPVYWIAAYVKVVTAVASVATAIALPLVMPRILANMATVREAEERSIQLAKANDDLSAANEKLQELDRLRRRFVARAAANVGDWEWDIPSGRVQWSPEVEDMHGFARGAFPGTFDAWKTSVHPDDLARTEATISSAFQNKSEYDIEYRTLHPDGSTYWIAGRGTVEYSTTGEPLRMAGMCMDISGRKRTEEALRKTEKLAAAGRLAATIAHEINNPLEAVTNLLYLARAEHSVESSRILIDMADRELQRVGHITRQTLGFYRQTSAPVMFELGDLLKSVVDVFQGKLSSREISAKVQVESPVHLYGAAGELRQVFANLLSNAIDASPAKSEVTIRVKETGSGAQVTIADRGAGIPEAARAQIFEPFFTTKKDVGTGLGLWISKQILENYGGAIRFRTCNGVGRSGTVFVVYLRKAEAASSTAA
jgi:PAS domain S-box-containing protein